MLRRREPGRAKPAEATGKRGREADSPEPTAVCPSSSLTRSAVMGRLRHHGCRHGQREWCEQRCRNEAARGGGAHADDGEAAAARCGEEKAAVAWPAVSDKKRYRAAGATRPVAAVRLPEALGNVGNKAHSADVARPPSRKTESGITESIGSVGLSVEVRSRIRDRHRHASAARPPDSPSPECSLLPSRCASVAQRALAAMPPKGNR